MAASIQITGVDQLMKKLGNVEGNKVLRGPMDNAMATLIAESKKYPQPTGGKYVRTDTLKNSWAKPENSRIDKTSRGLTGHVGTNVEYAPFVMSHQFQARHMTHWPTDMSIMAKCRNAIVADFERAIAKALK